VYHRAIRQSDKRAGAAVMRVESATADDAAAAAAPGPAEVLYDAACAPCRQLAELAARRAGGALGFASWQEFRGSEAARGLPESVRAAEADELRVWTGGELVAGRAAWALLVERHPDLAGLAWLARRLGLASSTPGAALESAGALLRRLCRRCGGQAGRR
jgi:hypothetical protein